MNYLHPWLTLEYIDACAAALHVRGWWAETWQIPTEGRPDPHTREAWVAFATLHRPVWARPWVSTLAVETNLRCGDLFNLGTGKVQVGVVGRSILNVGVGIVPYFKHQLAGDIGGFWYEMNHDELTRRDSAWFVFLPRLDDLLWMISLCGDAVTPVTWAGAERGEMVALVQRADRVLEEMGVPALEAVKP